MYKKIILAAVIVVSFTSVAFAGAEKVQICHDTGSVTDPFVVISISDSAYDAHIGHGDKAVGENNSCDGIVVPPPQV